MTGSEVWSRLFAVGSRQSAVFSENLTACVAPVSVEAGSWQQTAEAERKPDPSNKIFMSKIYTLSGLKRVHGWVR